MGLGLGFGLFLALGGLFQLVAAVADWDWYWDWYMQHMKGLLYTRILGGRTRVRVLNAIMGIILIIMGLSVIWGMVFW